MEKTISMADMMKELGYGCTVNVSQCQEMLSLFLPLSEVTIARVLATVVRTYAGLNDNRNVFTTFSSALGINTVSNLSPLKSWNVDILVDSIKQLVSSVIVLSSIGIVFLVSITIFNWHPAFLL